MRFMSAMCAVAAIAAAVALTPDASAQRRNSQATTVVVVNYQRVLAEFAIGRDMAAKLQQVRTEVQTEAQTLTPEGQSIEQERQRLATATRNMSPDQIRNSSTYAPQFQALQERLQTSSGAAAASRPTWNARKPSPSGTSTRPSRRWCAPPWNRAARASFSTPATSNGCSPSLTSPPR